MAKAIVCIGPVNLQNSATSISYSVAIIGPPDYSYGADYIVNTGISIAANLLAWRNKVIAEAATQGVTLAVSDVIVFGAPS